MNSEFPRCSTWKSAALFFMQLPKKYTMAHFSRTLHILQWTCEKGCCSMNGNWKLSDPYVYESLKSLQNQSIAVQTIRGSLRGTLKTVMPDHIVVEMGGSSFYVRTEQIIWIQPIKES